MGTAIRPSPALCVSAFRSQPSGGGGAAERARAGRGEQIEDGPRGDHRADLLARAAGAVAQAARFDAGCKGSAGADTRGDCGVLGGRQDRMRTILSLFFCCFHASVPVYKTNDDNYDEL